MNIFQKLFKKETKHQQVKPEGSTKKTSPKNFGTYIGSEDHAIVELKRGMRAGGEYSVLIYSFSDISIATSVMKDLPFIHLINETSEFTSDIVLNFGVYKNKYGTYEVLLSGYDLDIQTWENARQVFLEYKGTKIRESPPKNSSSTPKSKESGDVVFIQERVDRTTNYAMGLYDGPERVIESTYRIYRGTNAKTAQEFLSEHPVQKQGFYTIVETPEGNYGRDINGIYQERQHR